MMLSIGGSLAILLIVDLPKHMICRVLPFYQSFSYELYDSIDCTDGWNIQWNEKKKKKSEAVHNQNFEPDDHCIELPVLVPVHSIFIYQNMH